MEELEKKLDLAEAERQQYMTQTSVLSEKLKVKEQQLEKLEESLTKKFKE